VYKTYNSPILAIQTNLRALKKMSTGPSNITAPKRKKADSTGAGETLVPNSKKKRGQETDKLMPCHARNALGEIKEGIHLNEESMALIAAGMQDYLGRLVQAASLVAESRDNRKGTITSADVIESAMQTPMIFFMTEMAQYEPKERTKRTARTKKSKEEHVEQEETPASHDEEQEAEAEADEDEDAEATQN
jgi:hypothetical protein